MRPTSHHNPCAVQEGVTVLDIGTGTGILAVMAVQAGAAHVYACEVNAVLCGVARQVLQRYSSSSSAVVRKDGQRPELATMVTTLRYLCTMWCHTAATALQRFALLFVVTRVVLFELILLIAVMQRRPNHTEYIISVLQ